MFLTPSNTRGPPPGGTVVVPSITADEGTTISYVVEALDRDNDVVNQTVTERGEVEVELYPNFPNHRPESTVDEAEWDPSGYNPTAGTRRYTITVKLRAATEEFDTRTDRYLSGDKRGDRARDQIYIQPIGYWDHTGLDTPLRYPLHQKVIIKKKRGEIKGKVTDGATGLPVGADIWIVSAHPDIPTDFPEIFTSSNPTTGDYSTMMYANECTIACGRYYPTPDATATVTVPRDGSITVDFVLPPQGGLD
jgi:hypothetical protein